MAARLNACRRSKFPRTLFRNDDGSPRSFCADFTSEALCYIITRGGGKLVRSGTPSCVMLCESMTDTKLKRGFLPLDFIVDCVEGNTFLDIDQYRRDNLGLMASTSIDGRSKTADSDIDSVHSDDSFTMTAPKPRTSTRRIKYTDQEDFKIIRHLVTHKKCSQIGGNVVWKEMQLLKVINHSYQSMKARMKNHILPNIDLFDIPGSWKAKLTGDFKTKWQDGPVVFGQPRGLTEYQATLAEIPQPPSEENAETEQNVDSQSLQQSQGFDPDNGEAGSFSILDSWKGGNVTDGRNIGGWIAGSARSELEDNNNNDEVSLSGAGTHRESFDHKQGTPAGECRSRSRTPDGDGDDGDDDVDRLIVSMVQSTSGHASPRLSLAASSHSADRDREAGDDGCYRMEGGGKGNMEEQPCMTWLKKKKEKEEEEEEEDEVDSEILRAINADGDDEGNKDVAGPSKVARQIPGKKKKNLKQNAKRKGRRIHSDLNSSLSSIGSVGNCDLLSSNTDRTSHRKSASDTDRTSHRKSASDTDRTAHDQLESGLDMTAGTSTVGQRKRRKDESGIVDRGLSGESDFVNEFQIKRKSAATDPSPDQMDNNPQTGDTRAKETMRGTTPTPNDSENKERTLKRIKCLCKVYKLDVAEAATLMMEFQGSFQEAVQFMEN